MSNNPAPKGPNWHRGATGLLKFRARQVRAPGTEAEISLNTAGLPSGLYVVVGQQSDGKPRRYTVQIAPAN